MAFQALTNIALHATHWIATKQYCLIVSSSDDRTVKVWDAASGTCIHTFQEPKGFGNQVDKLQ